MPISQILPNGKVRIYNNQTGDVKDVAPEELASYNPQLVGEYEKLRVEKEEKSLTDTTKDNPLSFSNLTKQGQERLKSGESWGPVWNDVRRAASPNKTNEEIDLALGPQYKKPYAYEILKNRERQAEGYAEPAFEVPPEAYAQFQGIKSPPAPPQGGIINDLKSLIDSYFKKKITQQPSLEVNQTKVQAPVESAQLTPETLEKPSYIGQKITDVGKKVAESAPGRFFKGMMAEPGTYATQFGTPESIGEAITYSPPGAFAIGAIKLPKAISKLAKGAKTAEKTLPDIDKLISQEAKTVSQSKGFGQTLKTAKEAQLPAIEQLPLSTSKRALSPQTLDDLSLSGPGIPQGGKISSLPDIVQQKIKPVAPEDTLDLVREAIYKGESGEARKLYDEISKDFTPPPFENLKKEIMGGVEEALGEIKPLSEFGDYQDIARKMKGFLSFAGEKKAKGSTELFREHIPRKVFGVSSDEVSNALGMSESEFMAKIAPEVDAIMSGRATPAILKSFGGKVQKIKEMADALKLDKDFYKTIEGFNPTELVTIPSYKNMKPYRASGGMSIEPTEETLRKLAEKEGKASLMSENKLFNQWRASYRQETLTTSQRVSQLEKTIRQSTNEGINDAIKARTGDVTILDYVRTPENVFKKIGLSDQFDAIRKGTANYEGELKDHLQQMGKWYQQVKNVKGSEVRIFDYLDGQPVQLSETESKVATEIRNYLKQMAAKIGLPEDQRIQNYITHLFDPEVAKQQIPPELMAALEYATPRGVFNPFLEKRLGASGYLHDVWRALESYAARSLRKIHLDQPIDNMGEYVTHLPDGAQQYTNRFLNYLVGRPDMVESLLDQTLKVASKHLPNKSIQRYFATRPTKKIFGGANQMVYRGALGLNVSSALKNLTQVVNTFAEEGPKATMKGYLSLFNPSSLSEIEKKNLLSEMITAEYRNKPVRNAIEKADKVLFVLFDLAERINRGAAYFASKSNALQQGLSEDEAVKTALSQVRRTQFSYSKVDMPLVLQNPVLKSGFQFSTFPIKQAELIGGYVKNKEYEKLARYVMASLGITWAVGDYLGLDWKDAILRNVMPGLGPLADIASSGIEWATAKSEQKQEEAKKDFLKTGKLVIPAGLQTTKTLEGVKAYEQGFSKTESGRTRYRIEQTPSNFLKSIIFGQYSLPEAKKYFDKLDQPAKKKTKKLSSLPNIPQTKSKTLPPINELLGGPYG